MSELSNSASSDVTNLRQESARLRRELDAALVDGREQRDRAERAEEELERVRAKADAASRDSASEKSRFEDQVRGYGLMCFLPVF